MSLDRLNAIPTAHTPIGSRQNLLSNVPSSRLFRPDREYFEHACLPFVAVEVEVDGTHDNWHFDRPESLAVQTELGKGFAAAYFLFVSRSGSSAFPLPWIIDSMQHNKDVDGCDAVAQGFFFYLTKLLADFGNYVSAQDVEEHLKAVIANDRVYYEPQDLIEVGAE